MSATESAAAAASQPAFGATGQATLNALQDLMIPASTDGRMPSARSLGLYADSAGLTPGDLAVFASGLAQIEARAQATHGTPFAQLPIAAVAHDVLDCVSAVQSFYVMVEALARARGLDPDQPPHLEKVTLTR